jgi:uncharacterized protein YkwD
MQLIRVAYAGKTLMGSRKYGAALALAVTLLAGQAAAREGYVELATRLAATAEAQQAVAPGIEAALLRLVNAHRLALGAKALREAPELQLAARAQAMDLMGQGRVGHVSSSGHNFDSRMRALRPGVLVLPAMAENAARVSHAQGDDEALARNLMAQWLASPPHKHELESADYIAVATGVIHANGQVYADQIFVGPEVQTNMNGAAPLETAPAPKTKAKKKVEPGLY